jgi:hypothetical protein
MRLKYIHGVYTNKSIKKSGAIRCSGIGNYVSRERYEILNHVTAPKEDVYEELDKSERKRVIKNKKEKKVKKEIVEEEETKTVQTEKERQKELQYKDITKICVPKGKGNKCYPRYVPRNKDMPPITGVFYGKNEFKLFNKGYLYDVRKNRSVGSSLSDYGDSIDDLDIMNEINQIEGEESIHVEKYKIKTLG